MYTSSLFASACGVSKLMCFSIIRQRQLHYYTGIKSSSIVNIERESLAMGVYFPLHTHHTTPTLLCSLHHDLLYEYDQCSHWIHLVVGLCFDKHHPHIIEEGHPIVIFILTMSWSQNTRLLSAWGARSWNILGGYTNGCKKHIHRTPSERPYK